MIKRYLTLIAAAIFAATMITVAVNETRVSALPTVLVTDLGAGSHRYTATIIDPAGVITGYPRKSGTNPSVTGGCRGVYHRRPNGQQVFQYVTCPTPGSVSFTTPFSPACETLFTITIDGTSAYTDVLNSPCPPPPPAQVVITHVANGLVFTNPLNGITRASVTDSFVVPSLATTLTADGPFTYDISTRFAGIGLNRYVYFMAVVTVGPIDPGQTITVMAITP